MLRNHGELSFARAMTGAEGFLTLDLDDQYPLESTGSTRIDARQLEGAVKYSAARFVGIHVATRAPSQDRGASGSQISAIELVTSRMRSRDIILRNLVDGQISFDPEGLVVSDRSLVDIYIQQPIDLGRAIA
jgi:hypothetical protein